MKAFPFKLVKLSFESFKVQHEVASHFYEYLHVHPEIQLTYIVRSSGTLICGSRVVHFRPGDLFLFGSNTPHVFRNDSEENTTEWVESISLYLRPDILLPGFTALPETTELKQLVEKSRQGILFPSTTGSEVFELMKRLIHAEQLNRVTLLLQLLQHCIEALRSAQLLLDTPHEKWLNEAEGNRLNTIVGFALKEFKRDISLTEVANLANMTPHSFCRYFKQRTQKSFSSFITELRIDHACKSLKNKNVSITEIAYESGYNNRTHFNRDFKKLLGITPGEYRKELNNLF